MTNKNYRTSTLIGAFEAAVMLLSAPVSRKWFNCWGATEVEVTKTLPGDALVPAPRLAYTRAISINASAASVWPWLVQLGQARGGLYSYDGLENLIGCDIHSADHILPEHQNLQVGDQILFGPEAKKFPGQVVLDIQPEKAIIMCGLDPVTRQAEKSATWVLFLDEQADGSTRLLLRGRNGYIPSTANHIVWHIVEPLTFVMERRMLRGIKARVEEP